MQKKGLGRGLEALIPNANLVETEVHELKINDIEPNTDQPRRYFEEESIKNLSESIKVHGVVQPIIVTKEKGRFNIIAGERRWRAARIAGLKTIPAIVKEYAAKKAFEVALIENIQRQDLNAIEEAEAYHRLAEEYKLTQEEIASTVGKSRSAIANTVRLLALDKRVRDMICAGRISSGHARVLVPLKDKDIQYKIAKEMEAKDLSVREAEELIRNMLTAKIEKTPQNNKYKDVENDISEKLKIILGTKVYMDLKKNKGKIVIECYSNEEVDRVLEMLYSLNEKGIRG